MITDNIPSNIASTIASNMTNGTNTTSPPVERAAPPGPPLYLKIGLIIIMTMAVFGNAMVVYFITTRRRLRTKTNFMVVSLALSDLFVGLAIIPSYLACMYVKCDNNLSKLFYDGFLFVSVCNLCCITFDRFLAVTRPLRYHAKMTKRKVLVMIALSWIVPSLVSLAPVGWQYTDTGLEAVTRNNKIFYTLQVVVFMFFPCLIMLVAYAVIFNIAWKQTKHINRVLSSVNLAANNNRSVPIPTTSTREAKATLKVFGTVVLMFVFCWSLSAFRSIVFYYQLMDVPFDVIYASRLLLVGNSAINPIIYALWKRDIKMEILKLLKLNNRMVRPSSATFRSTQVFGGDNNSTLETGMSRKTSRVGSMQDISLPRVKKLNKPLNGIVNEATVEMIEVESKPEDKDPPTPEQTPATQTSGTVNPAVEIDGLV